MSKGHRPGGAAGSKPLIAAIFLGLLAGVAILAIGAVIVVESGVYDAGAQKPHGVFVSRIMHETYVRSAKLRARSVKAPASFTRSQVEAGLQEYQAHCDACHGGPGAARA